MAKAMFRAGDTVIVRRNDLQPQFVGKRVRIKKAFRLTDGDAECQHVYRLECGDETLKGVTAEIDLVKV